MTAEIKVGDRVRVAYDATVKQISATSSVAIVDDERGHEHAVALTRCEKLVEPMPTWQAGDVVYCREFGASESERTLVRLDRSFGGQWSDLTGTHRSPDMAGQWKRGGLHVLYLAAVSK